MSLHSDHMRVSDEIQRLPRDTRILWECLEKSTKHPLHRKRASELFLEVLALQSGGTEIDWPSIYCAVTTLTRLDKACLQARLAVGCSKSPTDTLAYKTWQQHACQNRDSLLSHAHKLHFRYCGCLPYILKGHHDPERSLLPDIYRASCHVSAVHGHLTSLRCK